MRPLLQTWVAVLALCAPGSLWAEEGVAHIQIRAEPGVVVELDGVTSGVVEGPEGIIFRAVQPGVHHVVARRPGYEPQTSVLRVEVGQVAVHKLLAWRPKLSKGQRSQPTGAVIVQTFPVEATVDAKKLGWAKIKKGEQPFVAPYVPAGEHKMTFCNDYKCIDYRALVQADRVLSIFVDFEPGEVSNVSAEHMARMERWSRGCAEADDMESCRQACEMDAALFPQRPSKACLRLARNPPGIAERPPVINEHLEGEMDTVVEPASTPGPLGLTPPRPQEPDPQP